MNQLLGLISYRVLAEGNIFELLGPLLLFGIYAVGALAKKWASSQEPGGKPSEELQRAVRAKYKEIHARQTGKAPAAPKFQPQRQSGRVPPAPIQQKFERPAPVRQVTERRTAYPVQNQRQQQPTRPVPPTEPRYRPRTVRPNIQTPKPIKATHKPEKKIVSLKKQQVRKISVYSEMLRQPQNLRSVIILKEILDKPVSMRGLY